MKRVIAASQIGRKADQISPFPHGLGSEADVDIGMKQPKAVSLTTKLLPAPQTVAIRSTSSRCSRGPIAAT